MALFNSNMQSGPQAQQLGFAPQAVQAPSFAPPTVPTGYGQMQGQPLLSRSPNYGVATGIAALLGGQNPMGAPQASALLNPQQAAPNPMEAINPATGQPFQVFDQATRDQITTDQAAQQEMYVAAQERQAAEQLASQTAEQAERDRIAAEQAAAAQAEQDRIAYEQAVAAAEAQAERDRVAAEAQAESDRIAAEAAEESTGTGLPANYDPSNPYANNPYFNPGREYFNPNFGGEGGNLYGGFIGSVGGEPIETAQFPDGNQRGALEPTYGRGGIASMMQNAPLNTGAPATQATREEQRDIMNGFLGGNAIFPGDPGYEAALAEAGPASGGLFSGVTNLTPEQIEKIKAAQAANPGGGFLGKIRAGNGSVAPDGKFQETLLNGVGSIPSKPNTTKMTNNRTPKKFTAQDIQRAMSRMNFGGMGGMF